MKARKSAPKQPTRWDLEQAYRVWAKTHAYVEDPKPWKCVALFRFGQEALDYIAYCQDRGVDVVYQTPSDVRLIQATDKRVVYQAEEATA